MSPILINDPDDPRIASFRHLKRTNATRWAQMFVCEGEKLVTRLLASPFPVESLLVGESHLAHFETPIPAGTPVYVVPDKLVEEIVGFNFHRGLLACGRRLPSPSLASLAERRVASSVERPVGSTAEKPGRLTLVVCVDVHDPENLGTILRTRAALGIDGLLLGGRCADPLSRRVLRVSMGAALSLPIAIVEDARGALSELRAQHAVHCWGTVLDPLAPRLGEISRPERLALILGNEAHGLDDQWRALCDTSVTIPMRPGVDSLNVAVAAGIFLFELSREPG